MEVFCLRIRRSKKGRLFPFDRIYLVKHGTHDALKELFRYALVMPVEENLKGMLKALAIDEYVNLPFDRNDEESTPQQLSEKGWHKFLGGAEWVMCVPILTRFMKKVMPRYLVAAGWYKGVPDKDMTRVPFPHMTYLQTPDKNIRPVCVACPRIILHQNGECQVGNKVCYESLALGLHDHFAEGLNVADPPSNIRETDVEEITRDYVQEDIA